MDLGPLPTYYAPYSEPRLFLFLLLGLPALVIFGIRQARRSSFLSADQRLLLAYLCANIIFLALVGNSVEVGENQRFRFTTDPLSVVLLGVLLQTRLAARASGHSLSTSPATSLHASLSRVSPSSLDPNP